MDEVLVQKMIDYNGLTYGKDFNMGDLKKDFHMFDRIVVAEKGRLFVGLKANRLVIRLDENDKVIMVVPR